MKSQNLFLVYASNNSHFLNIETHGKYILKVFTDSEEISAKELIEEFHLTYNRHLHQYFLGPFPDSNEVKKMSYEIGEFLDVEKVILLNRDQYNEALVSSFHRSELLEKLLELGDQIVIDPDSSNASLWNKIFN